MWAEWVHLLWWADYCGHAGRHCWTLFQVVARPCLVQRLPATSGQGQFLTWLDAESRVSQSWCQHAVGWGWDPGRPLVVLACWCGQDLTWLAMGLQWSQGWC